MIDPDSRHTSAIRFPVVQLCPILQCTPCTHVSYVSACVRVHRSDASVSVRGSYVDVYIYIYMYI